MPDTTRRLAAILFADIAGYTAMMQHDESEALDKLARFKQTLEAKTAEFQGSIIQYYGDGCLVVFDSPVSALSCAASMQETFRDAVPVRIGIHLGDVVFRENNAFGDAVNIASRIESMGVPGAVLLSQSVRQQIRNHPEFQLASLGNFEFKNVDEPMEVFALANAGFPVPERQVLSGKFKAVEQPRYRKWLARGLPALAILALGIFILNTWFPAGKTASNTRHPFGNSIAVLPFEDLSPGKDQEYFSLGMTEEILYTLAQIEGLKVVGRTSSFSFKNKNLTIGEIGKLLKVNNILEGSIQKLGNRVRITAQLIKVAEDSHFWSRQYERNLDDIFALQKEIAADIAKQLQLTLMENGKPVRKINPEAYDWYLKGNQAIFNTPVRSDSAFRCFHRALQFEPSYAPAYTRLAYAYYSKMQDDASLAESYIPPGILAAQIAGYHDPGDVEAKCLIALLKFTGSWDWSQVELLERYENNTLPGYLLDEKAFLLTYLGRHEEAIKIGKKNLADDPLNQQYIRFQSTRLVMARRYREAIQLITGTGENGQLPIKMGDAYMGLGDYAKAIDFYKEGRKVTTDNSTIAFILSNLVFAYSKMGNSKMAATGMAELTTLARNGDAAPSVMAVAYGVMGNTGKAAEWLDKAAKEKDNWLLFMKVGFWWDPLRSDPGFQQLVNEVFPSGK